MLRVVSMDKMHVELGRQHSRMMSSTCSSTKYTTLGAGVHWRLHRALSFFKRSRKLGNSSSWAFFLDRWRALITCLLSLGKSADHSQSSMPSTSSEISRKIHEGPFHPDVSLGSLAFVDGAVGMNCFPERGCLWRIIRCSSAKVNCINPKGNSSPSRYDWSHCTYDAQRHFSPCTLLSEAVVFPLSFLWRNDFWLHNHHL